MTRLIGTLVLAFSCASMAILLYAFTLPQFGDGAIGTFYVFFAAALLYLLALAMAATLGLIALFRPGSSGWHPALIMGALGVPIFLWLSLGVLI